MNGQVLVFNNELSLYDAISALAENNIFCGVIWDETTKTFLDLFTIRDIMEILILMTEHLETICPGKAHTIPANDQKVVNECIMTLYQKLTQKKSGAMEIGEADKPYVPSPGEESAAVVGYEVLIGILKTAKLANWAQISNHVVILSDLDTINRLSLSRTCFLKSRSETRYSTPARTWQPTRSTDLPSSNRATKILICVE